MEQVGNLLHSSLHIEAIPPSRKHLHGNCNLEVGQGVAPQQVGTVVTQHDGASATRGGRIIPNKANELPRQATP